VKIIKKLPSDEGLTPNRKDYREIRSSFSWEQVRQGLDGLPDDMGLNIAHEAIDRHALGSLKGNTALRYISVSGQTRDYTYDELKKLSNRFANLLRHLGITKGEAVFATTGHIPELYVGAFGTLKNQSVFCSLFSAFGPNPLATRLSLGKARVLITTKQVYLRKIQTLRSQLPDLEHVLITDHSPHSGELPTATLDLNAMLEQQSDQFTIPPTDPETQALLHFTSGTTGKPKGVIHVHAAVVAHYASAKYALDLHPGDIFWCTAEPGWVTGISYGVVAPFVIGATIIADSGAFDAEGWYRLLQDQGVNVWYTAPTALRMMMRLDIDLAQKYDLSHLRFVGSVGEPLNAEAVLWGMKALNKPIHDTWWQTETGAIMIANLAIMDIKPGSMGKPLPGIEVAIVERDDKEGIKFLERPDVCGELVLRTGWPSMFRGYLDEQQRYQNCFIDGWYLTGDLVRRDEDGYLWFVGRADDMIKSAGHLIGPAEVERVLLIHEAVAEAAVIGEYDPLIYQSVKAYITLKSGCKGDDTLKREILAHARKSLGATLAPRVIEFCDDLPRNFSGKVLRRVLQTHEKDETSKNNST